MIGKPWRLAALCCGLLLALQAHAQSDEANVGKAAAAQLLGAAPLLGADKVQQYVNLVGQVLAPQTGVSYPWHFGVVKSDAINAFAMPGGYVLLSAGLLKTLESEDELAFVIAHEMAHVARKHYYQVVQRQRLADQATKGLQQLNAGGSELAQASGQIYARGLDKTAEYEADRLGTEYMTHAGYDPVAVVNVLERLQKYKGSDPRAELLFSTHPSPSERIDMLFAAGIDRLSRSVGKGQGGRALRFRSFVNML